MPRFSLNKAPLKPPPASWWTTAAPVGFYAEARHQWDTRMKGSRFDLALAIVDGPNTPSMWEAAKARARRATRVYGVGGLS